MPFLPSPASQVTAANGAVTENASDGGVITTESLTTAAAAAYTCTCGCDAVLGPNSIVLASIQNGSNTQGDPDLATVTTTFGQIVFKVVNRHASQALNGTLKLSFIVFN